MLCMAVACMGRVDGSFLFMRPVVMCTSQEIGAVLTGVLQTMHAHQQKVVCQACQLPASGSLQGPTENGLPTCSTLLLITASSSIKHLAGMHVVARCTAAWTHCTHACCMPSHQARPNAFPPTPRCVYAYTAICFSALSSKSIVNDLLFSCPFVPADGYPCKVWH